MASFRPRFRKEMIWGVKSKPAPAFPSRVDDCVPGWFLLLTGVDEARKLTLWMKANIGPREAICVKYVLNTRKSSHGLLVWKRRRRRKRPGSAALRGLRSTLLHYSIPIFLFSFLFKASYSFCPSRDHWRKHLRQNHPRHSLLLLCCCSALGRHPAPSTCRCCAAQRVRLRGLSPRPIPPGVE
jgi:hypothetical protein